MQNFPKAFPSGFARVLLESYERWTTIPAEVPAAALLVSLTLPMIREHAVIERMQGVEMDLRLWVSAAGRSGAGKTTGVRDVRARIGDCGVALLDEASGPAGLLEALDDLNGAAVLRVTEEAGMRWQALRDGDRNAVELSRYDLRLYDRDAITRRSGEKRRDIEPGPMSSLEFAVSDQLPSALCRSDLESGFASRRCWLLAPDDPVNLAKVARLHDWRFDKITTCLERAPLPDVRVEPVYRLSRGARLRWDKSWRRLVEVHGASVGEAYLRRADSAGLVCAVICRRLAGKSGPELDADDIRYGAMWTEHFCVGAADLMQRVSGGRFYARLAVIEEWVAKVIFDTGREPTARDLQRHDQRTFPSATIARRELPRLVARARARLGIPSHPVT